MSSAARGEGDGFGISGFPGFNSGCGFQGVEGVGVAGVGGGTDGGGKVDVFDVFGGCGIFGVVEGEWGLHCDMGGGGSHQGYEEETGELHFEGGWTTLAEVVDKKAQLF